MRLRRPRIDADDVADRWQPKLYLRLIVLGLLVAYAIGGDYRLAFLVDPSGSESVIRLKDLSLEKIRKDEKGTETRREILKTSINVQAGHTYICGIGRDESASAALFVVFEPRFRGGPGIH